MTLAFAPDSIPLDPRHVIGGQRVAGVERLAVVRPSDGVTAANLPVADASLVDEAVRAAHAALDRSGWGRAMPRDRTRAMHRWADLVEAHAAELARLEAVVSTRPVDELPGGDIAITAEQIRFFAELADKEGGTVVPTRDASLGMIVDSPIGVIGAITPWNFPLSMAAWKMGPALAAGNAIVLKPSEMTPFSTLRLAELAVEAGIPAGLVNIVLGDGPTTGAALVAHPGIGKVSFTGSTLAGSAIAANLAATGLKPMTLELGGKSPQVVFADADADLAARSIARSILFNAGQACVAGSRVIVARKAADELRERLTVLMRQPRVAPTWGEGSAGYPIISGKQLARIDGLVQAARKAGAEVLLGGGPMQAEGFFYTPTILATDDPDNPAIREEIFGPVLTLQTFEDEEEAIGIANASQYGLCAGLYTRDLSRALRLTQRLEAGTVWVNRYGRSRDHILPTGGWKQSGLGHDLGREAYRACRRTKSVLIDL
ncbi:MAG: aldehyde dehydrogenase family protein [Beijerinckiaceae bacterium]|jgi:aldehyde dehydrogenase (NAD+)|nr:aldehyde dehydrogenase family protein [Beijerinckiaceae bacterium]